MQRQRSRLLELRVKREAGELMPTADHEAVIDALAGLTLTKLSGWPKRVAGNDLALRRKCEAVLHELRTEMAQEALR